MSELQELANQYNFDVNIPRKEGASDTEMLEYLRLVRQKELEMELLRKARESQQQPIQEPPGGGVAKNIGQNILKKKLGLGDSSTTNGGSGVSTGGLVSAAIAAQIAAAESTRRSGRNEGGILQGQIANDPWQGYVGEKLGLGLTPGEKFDKDQSVRTGLGAMQQWAYPGQNLLSQFVGQKLGLGDVGETVVDPVGKLIEKI
jgi:hypothetical protein